MAAAGLVVVWGLLGTLDAGNLPYSGYTTDGNNEVVQVEAGSPAADAGIQVGDVIHSVGGIPVTDVKALNARGRPSIGAVREIMVDRDSGPAALNIAYGSLPSAQAGISYLASLMALCFLFFGLWAQIKAPNRSTDLLAWLGISFGVAFMAAPYFASGTLRNLTGAVVTVAVIMGFAILLDFLTRAGSEDAYTEERITSPMVYWPAMAVAALLAGLAILQPAATGGLNVTVRAIVGIFVVGYFGMALVRVVRNFTAASASERASRQLGTMLMGAMVGLLPLTVASLITLVAPQVAIPTGQYWFLTLVAIPITFALAAVNASQAKAPAMAAAAAPAESPGAAEEETPPTDPEQSMSHEEGGADVGLEDVHDNPMMDTAPEDTPGDERPED